MICLFIHSFVSLFTFKHYFMSSLFQPTKLSNHSNRNGFDLSKKVSFTAKAGELLPVYCQEVLPGDSFKLDVSHFLRTQPLNTACFARMREYYDFYFVPIRLLWRFAPQFFTQMVSNTQSAIDSRTVAGLSDIHPYITSVQMVSDLQKLSSFENSFGFNRANLACKLLGYLGYYFMANPSEYASNSWAENAVNLNIFPLLAYQKIYSDHFRNTQWQDSEPYTFNVDYAFGSDPILSDGFDSQSDGSLATPYDLRYCDYKKDMFTGIIPNSQYGAVSTLDTSSVSVGDTSVLSDVEVRDIYRIYGSFKNSEELNYATEMFLQRASGQTSWNSSNTSLGQVAVAPDSGSSPLNAYRVVTPSVLSSILKEAVKAVSAQFSILELRKAEALQKFREIQLSNEQDYVSQIKAMFDTDVSDILSGLSLYLGGSSSDIDVSEVINTSLSDSSSEADIKGKGTSAGRGSISFKAQEHGILMCIYHVLPLQEYDNLVVSPLVRKTSFDMYAQPVFDRLGYEPLTSEYFVQNMNPDGWSDPVALGYNPRYIDYKTDYDVVLGDFAENFGGTSLQWNTPLHIDDLLPYNSSDELYTSLNWRSFKVNPHILDSIFGVNADDEVSTDQFLITSFFDVKAVRNLDRDGMPY